MQLLTRLHRISTNAANALGLCLPSNSRLSDIPSLEAVRTQNYTSPRSRSFHSNASHQKHFSVGYCDNNEEDDIECHLVRGITSILLDNGAADAESVAYATIQRVLTDTLFLNQFTTTHVLSAEFVRPIQENLILLNEPPLSTNASDGTAKIAIATASVSCLLTCVFLYGLYRARALSRERAQTPVKARVAHLQAKRRRYFQELQQDQQLEPGWMVTDSLQLPVPSITWSVSDLTSDSGSIRSSMSYATKLDRIEEEVPVDGHDEENVAIEHPSSLPSLDLKHEHLDFIAHWNHHTIDFARGNGETDMEYVDQDAETPVRKNRIEDFDATAEEDTLTGCRYLDDSQEDDEDVLEVDQSNDTTPTVETFSIVRYSSVFGDPPMNITAGFFKFVKTEVFDLVAAPESIDQEEGLERWFRNVLLDLHRALHQKRLAL